MRVKRTRRQPAAYPEVPRTQPDGTGGELGALLERQRTELEGCVAEAEGRAVQAQLQADERIDEQRRESEARILEEQRTSEERLEAERNASQARVDDAKRLLKEGETRAVTAEEKLKGKGLRPRAARKLAEARQALGEERAATQRLREEGKRLEGELQGAQEQEQGLRRNHADERAELEARVAQLAARTHELEATLKRERADFTHRVAEFEQRVEEAGAEHAREHGYRRELEVTLVAELSRGDEARGQLETEVAAAKTHRQRVEQLEHELGEVREEATAERAERQRFEQRLETLLHGVTDARTAREQRPNEPEQALGTVESVEIAERSPDEGSWSFERKRFAAAQDASVDDVPTPERPGNGQPPNAAGEARPKQSNGERSRRSRRWRRRSSLPCAVCHRPRPALSDAELTESGWRLSGAGALCASCQGQGWQYPADATVPFRRVDTRAE